MRVRLGLGIAVALALGLGSSCGRQPTRVSSFGLEPRYVTVPAAMGPLIPADAVGLLVLASIDEAERSLRELRSNSTQDSIRIDLVEKISQRFAIPAEAIDRTRPAALALSLFNLGRPIPIPTVILPVHDETQVMEALRARSGRPEPLGNKGYVGVPLMPGYELGTGIPPLAKDLPAGSITMRLRVDRILQVVQPFVDMALEKMSDEAAKKSEEAEEGAHHKAMEARTASALAQQLLDRLSATETLECGVRTQGGNLAVAYRMQTTPGSPNVAATAKRAAGLVDLARSLPEEYPVMGLVAMDFAQLIDFRKNINATVMEESMGELPESIREYMQSLMERSLDLYRLADDQLFYAMRFTDSGAEIIQVLSTQDPAKFIEESRRALGLDLMESAGLGTVEWEEPEDVNGVRIEGVRVRWNLGKILELHRSAVNDEPEEVSLEEAQRILRVFFGGDAMVVRFAAVGDRVVVVTHPSRTAIESCVANLKKGGHFPVGLQAARGYGKDPLCFWAQADVREILLPVFKTVHPDTTDAQNRQILHELEAMAPMSMTAYTTAGHQAYVGACSLNLAPLQELSKILGHKKHEHLEEVREPSEP